MAYVDVNGIRSYYERAGRIGSTPLVAIHGASQDTLSWRYAIDALAERYDVVAVDLPGHGKSGLAIGAGASGGALASTPDNARHVLALCAALGLERPILMGHSMGGGVAVSAAAQAPDRVAGLVLVDGAPYNVAATSGYNPILLDMARINPTDWFEVSFRTLLGSATPAGRGDEIVAEARRCIPEVAFTDIRAFSSYRLEDDIGRVVCPVVLIEGEEDWSVPPEAARRAAAALSVPHAFVLFEGVGHFPQSERPELFNPAVLDSLRRLGL
ncbi:alpha/beta fold hydrolase [Azospirillum doebereinerae]|uniref:Alpha/beta hydrolase n=1 Tax=Azospirillum doebereinerae TaxID=92933 RepID=A0A3S1CEY9_9PROT|nr:alpha/beta hydrolase [Azospirillum doebereinerae]MCG5238326.1 alpha/beta hydrolase [Azospirillum doebereinerae]RUQ66791.1 alpha/beta hydrolase [Azospirillum doebereinerae]